MKWKNERLGKASGRWKIYNKRIYKTLVSTMSEVKHTIHEPPRHKEFAERI